MSQITDGLRRLGALAPAALLLALCLLAVGAQAMTGPVDTTAPVAGAAPEVRVSPPATTLVGYETALVRDADQVEPAIYGTRIVWRDMRYDDFQGDIYSYDLATHIEQPEIASRSDYGKFTTSDYDAVVSSAGIFAVWSGRSDADINNEIIGRTLAGDPVNVTLLGAPGQRYISDLAIDGNWLVYVLSSGDAPYTLIKYDTTSRQYWTVRTAANEIRSPDIVGDATVVWQEYDGNDWNVWAEIPGHASPVALSNDPGDQVTPTVSGTRVVWADNRSGNWDLYAADLSQANPVGTPWLVAPGDQTNPRLSGDRLVWQDNRNGDWDIYTGSLSSAGVATVSTANGDQVAPDINGDRIVWQDRRNGNWDIYMFTLSATGPVPVPTPAPLVITSPGTYSVAADGYDGNATPIEIRSSNVVLDGGNHIIDGSGRAGSCGIRIAGAGTLSNVVVRNVRLTNWETGIRADNLTGSVIEASTISHNQQGIVLDHVQDVQVRNSTVTANEVTGIVVRASGNTTLRDNDVRRTGDGIEIHLQTLMDLDTFAVQVTGSTGTVVAGNDLGGRYGSLDLTGETGTRVTGNQLTGQWLGILALSRSDGGVVYNNLFRNYENLYGTAENASWNTTRSPGPNIVGGPSIGGNFWTNLDGTGFSETHPDANRDGFCDQPFDNGWGGTDSLPLAAWNGSGPGPTPYKPLSVPGRIQAEDYNLGGEGVAYHDTTAGNSGGAYRQDDVDIESAGGVTHVGWIRNGEFLTYTATVAQAGTYTMTARVASPNTGRTIALSVDGAPAATIAVPNTGSFATFRDVGVPVTLAAGTHVFRLTFAGDGQNLDWIEFAPVSMPPVQPNGTPYKPLAIPGTIQAEDYNLGGEGVAYHDTTAGNSGGAYRQDGVDIESAGGRTNVGWIRTGEWLAYTATVQSAGTYTMTANMASPNSGRTVAVSVDGTAAGTLAVPNTGSFTTYRTVSVPVTLAAGSHTLKLAFAGDGQNLDWFAFGTVPVITTTPTTPGPSGGASFTAAPATAPYGSAVKFTVTPPAGKSIGSAWWSFDAPAHLNTWNSRVVNPTFYYPQRGTFSPLVKLTYTDGSTETVQRTGYVRAT